MLYRVQKRIEAPTEGCFCPILTRIRRFSPDLHAVELLGLANPDGATSIRLPGHLIKRGQEMGSAWYQS